MRSALLYLLAAVFLVLIVSVAWWSREFVVPAVARIHYVAQPGDTLPKIATEHGLSPAVVAKANGFDEGMQGVEPGTEIVIPPAPKSATDVWGAHLAGLLPSHLRGQVLGIGLVLGVASYAATQSAATGSPDLTPQFVFGAIKDGFAWSAAFPLFARAFGLREGVPGGGASPPVAPAGPG